VLVVFAGLPAFLGHSSSQRIHAKLDEVVEQAIPVIQSLAN
jgi:hypothetical protein